MFVQNVYICLVFPIYNILWHVIEDEGIKNQNVVILHLLLNSIINKSLRKLISNPLFLLKNKADAARQLLLLVFLDCI